VRVSQCFVLFAVAAFLCGCTQVASVRPIYTREEAETPHREPRLEGEWVMANPDPTVERGAEPQSSVRVNIGNAGVINAPYYADFRGKDEPSDERESFYQYEIYLVPINNDSFFFDAVLSEREEKGQKLKQADVLALNGITGHQLGRVWIGPQFVRFGILDSEWVTTHWPANDLYENVTRQHERSLTLLNQTAELREFLQKNARDEEAFAPALYLCRPGADCTKLAVEDQLARKPDDAGALRAGVNFFAKRGDFARAIALQRHSMEIEVPADEAMASQQKYELAHLLLLNRKFAEAREVLKGVRVQPAYSKPSTEELIVRSYFLQGDYAATVQMAKALSVPEELRTADSIILAYFALQRLGKTKEAESYLREETAAFRGTTEEHLFLLKLTGRLTNIEWRKDMDRDWYYTTLSDVLSGKIRDAVTLLQQQIAADRKDNLWRLAAEIELERLNKSKPQ
jgi:hypothetical protein